MSGKIDLQRRVLNTSQCSCKECDSVLCFKKRRQSAEFCTCKKCESVVCLKTKPLNPVNCSCDKCVDSKTCFFYANTMVGLEESKSDVLKVEPNKIDNFDKNKSDVLAKEKPKSVNGPCVKDSIYDSNKNTRLTSQKPSKYSHTDAQVPNVNRFGDSSELGNIDKRPYSKVRQNKTISLNKTGNPSAKVSENNTDSVGHEGSEETKTVSIVNETDINSIETEIPSSKLPVREPDPSIKLQKTHSGFPHNKTDNLDKFEIVADRLCTSVNSVAKNYPQTGFDSFAAKLSAQVMDVPYNDFVKTVPSHKSDNSLKAIKLTNMDIINRIKEAYKSCSCKVCECIANITCPGTVARDNVCRCKPCECDDCHRVNEALRKKYQSRKIKGSANIVSNFCLCEPCKCMDCKMMATHPKRTIVVAPVGEETQRRVCQCSPCGCLECGNVYGTIATSLTHEISTGVSRHRNCRCDACLNEACDQDITDSCRCEQRDRVMRKPVQRDKHDYDIHRATISNTNPSTQGEGSKFTKHNTIAMFTALTNTKPLTNLRPGPARDNYDTCNCDDCQRLKCESNERIPPLNKSQNFCALKRVYKLPNISNACKCVPCKCQICKPNIKCFVEQKCGNNCRCEVCGCLDCANTKDSCSEAHVINRSINKCTSSQGICNCVPCECLDCVTEKARHKCTGDLFNKQYLDNAYDETAYSTKQDTLKDSMSNTLASERYINRIHTDCDRSKNCFGKNSIHSFVSKGSKPDMLIYHTCLGYINNSIRNSGRGESPDQTNDDDQCQRTISCTRSKCSKCNTQLEYEDDRETKYMKKDTGNIESQISETYISAVSSCETSYIVHECGSVTPISKKQTTGSLRQSSCNSSGHDYSDYLIRFPRTPAETCINEVMKLNLDRKLNFNRINVSLKANPENDCMKSTRTFLNSKNEPFYPKYSTEETCDQSNATANRRSKNFDFPISCDCDPCDCDRCLFTRLRFRKCKCDCIACNCSGTCFSEDQSIYIRKNEGTQTTLKFFQDHGQDSLDSEQYFKLNALLYSYSKDNEMSRNEDTSYSNQYMNISNRICPYDFICRSQDSYIKNNVEFLSIPIHINYESVQNTLREARAFSLELLQILEKYEKANREFESMSQKLKQSHESLLKSDISPMQNKNDTQYIDVSNTEKEHKKERNQCLLRNVEPKKERQENSLAVNEKIAVGNKLTTIHGNEVNATGLPVVPVTNSSKNIENLSPRQSTEAQDFHTLSSYNIIDEVCKQLYFKERKELKLKKRYRAYRKLIKRAIATARQFNSNSKYNDKASGTTTSENESTHMVVDEQNNNETKYVDDMIPEVERNTKGNVLIEDMKKMDVVFNSTPINISHSFRKLEEQTIKLNNIRMNDNSIKEKSNESQERKPIQDKGNFALLKNISLDDNPTNKANGVTSKLHVMEINVQETVELMPSQAKAVEDAQLICYGNNALTNMRVRVENQIPKLNDLVGVENKLHNEETSINARVNMAKQQQKPKDLLNFPLLNNTVKNTLSKPTDIVNTEENNLHAMASAKNSCDAMKLSFKGVRRVSDHTILVKWNPPRSTKDIQGYELLVDGRAVQKVLNPTRCMAVVTCLPPTDKVLLTIRILTTAAGRSDYYPSTTIVYRPRPKMC